MTANVKHWKESHDLNVRGTACESQPRIPHRLSGRTGTCCRRRVLPARPHPRGAAAFSGHCVEYRHRVGRYREDRPLRWVETRAVAQPSCTARYRSSN
ncbi:hypothetical protein HaLaN_14321 [Haematococcus lacustris]|uniref:Uncharacterized protein n=1 Tax=Haematococcus lacustris TaxID=44745 RepID=A0A699Z505_HAELA|nr:hypothetical protein HaLaN_14321 [Haematococcus lacustris]